MKIDIEVVSFYPIFLIFYIGAIIARYPIEESMERRPNNLTLYDTAS